jgi:clostripain
VKEPVATNYMPRGGAVNDWLYYPFFDLYDLAERVKASDTFRPGVRQRAGEVMAAVETFVVSSFGQGRYKGFRPGKHGVSIVFPDGAAEHKGKRHWAFCRWYSPLDVRELDNDSFGLYSWCKDGATPGNDKVENWFELLDSWYDTTNDRTGGLNGYRW